jgi:hypothetical protein
MTWKRYMVIAALAATALLSLVGCGDSNVSAVSTSATTAPGSPDYAANQQGERRSPPAMDYAAAADKLGVTEQQLKDVLVTDGQTPPTFSTAAATLGVSEEALRDALGFQGGNKPPGGNPPTNMPQRDTNNPNPESGN